MRSLVKKAAGSILVAALGCAPVASPDPAMPPPHAPHDHAAHQHGGHQHGGHDNAAHGGHQHGAPEHGDMVHRFQNAAEWAKVFEGPERDAWQKPADVVALLQLTPGMKVADIGAGTGYFAPHLSRAVGATGSVFALDVEDDMVTYMNERVQREKLTNVTPRKVAYDDPKLAAGSVDRILIVDTWHHIEGREAYAAKLRDALVPGGFVAVVDFTMEATHGPPKNHRIAPEQLKKELESAGLSGEIAVETLPEQYVIIARKAAK